MSVKSEFYVYVFFRLDGSPCYVGKGKKYRWREHFKRSCNAHLAAIMAQSSKELPMVKVRENLTETEAFEIEAALIRALGRKEDGGPLVNHSTGGEGSAGRKMSLEEIERRRAIFRRPEVIEKMRQSHLGKPSAKKGKKMSPASREKMRIAQTGKKQSEETIRRRVAVLRGQKRSPEFRERMRQLNLGMKKSAEARAKMSLAKKGKPLSEAHKLKISAALFSMPEKMAAAGRLGAARRWGQQT